jgi:tRNA (mo5U34)-methyltransferase
LTEWTPDRVRARIAELGPWFHNLRLKDAWTAPNHFLGDYPNVKWQCYAGALPADLCGKTVLDIGCNAGFFSMEMKRRGANRVLAIDFDEAYLKQARFAAEIEGLDIEFRKMSVYDVAAIGETFDIVFFIGVFYHLRHPLLALDLIHEHVARDMLVFQSLQRGSTQVASVADDYDFNDAGAFGDPGYPLMYFIEKNYAHDPTNWWVPNRAGTEAMLRSAGFDIIARPEDETYLCRRVARPDSVYGAVYPARGNDKS